MQGNSQGARMERLPLGSTPVLNQLPFHPETTSPAQDEVQLIRVENKAASQQNSRAVDSATLIVKNTAL